MLIYLCFKPGLKYIQSHSFYLLAGGLALLAQLRFTKDPSLMSPGGLNSTCVFFGESEKSSCLCSTAFWLTLWELRCARMKSDKSQRHRSNGKSTQQTHKWHWVGTGWSGLFQVSYELHRSTLPCRCIWDGTSGAEVWNCLGCCRCSYLESKYGHMETESSHYTQIKSTLPTEKQDSLMLSFCSAGKLVAYLWTMRSSLQVELHQCCRSGWQTPPLSPLLPGRQLWWWSEENLQGQNEHDWVRNTQRELCF